MNNSVSPKGAYVLQFCSRIVFLIPNKSVVEIRPYVRYFRGLFYPSILEFLTVCKDVESTAVQIDEKFFLSASIIARIINT